MPYTHNVISVTFTTDFADRLNRRRTNERLARQMSIYIDIDTAVSVYGRRNMAPYPIFYFDSWPYRSTTTIADRNRASAAADYANRRLAKYGVTRDRIVAQYNRLIRLGFSVMDYSSADALSQTIDDFLAAAIRDGRYVEPRRGRPRSAFRPVSHLGNDEFEASDLDEQKSVVKPEGCQCKPCKVARRDGTTIPHATIHSYSGMPRGGWKTRGVKNDKATYYLGVELETDDFGQDDSAAQNPFTLRRDRVSSSFSGGQAADLRLPKTLWYPKRDSSVSGPEFASHPATISYWNAHRKQLSEMFTNLLHAGFRSHDNDRCGMHINVSRTAFEDEDHLRRFLKLLYVDPEWARRISQRTINSLHWCEFNISNEADIEGFIRATRNNGAYGSKYVVFGAPYGGQRFEFRLPRGTLRVDRFFKNLQWLVSMVEYTRRKTAKSETANYMSYVVRNKKKYGDLHAFLLERGFVPA